MVSNHTLRLHPLAARLSSARRGWLLALCCLAPLCASAQQYGNEWINYAQQYYKVPVTQPGIYRLAYSDLQRAGLPLAGIDPRRLQVYHRGVEQAIVVAGEGDAFFDEADYVEFYGEGNDGTLDAELYQPAAAQPHKYYSLYSDTAYYFITWRLDNGLGRRMAAATEPNPGNLVPEPYHWEEKRLVLTNEYDPGRLFPEAQAAAGGEYSFYDYGEGWTGVRKNKFESIDYTLPGLTAPAPNAPKPQLEVLLAGRNNYRHNIELFAGPAANALRSLGVLAFDFHTNSRLNTTLEPAEVAGGSLVVRMRVNGTPEAPADAASVSLVRLRYPQQWVMDGQARKRFELEARSGGPQHVEIAGAPENTSLYDLTDKAAPRRIGATRVGGRLAATVSNARTLYAHAGFIPVTAALQRVVFRNMNALSPDYLIVTHPVLRRPAGEVADPVAAYAAYRASPQGGGHDTLVVHVDQLYDQFSYGEYTPLAIRRFVRWMYARSRPEYLFLIGRGLLPDMVRTAPARTIGLDIGVQAPDLVPPMGRPGSDFGFSTGLGGPAFVPALATGRISALNPQQVLNYLTKVKEHESTPPDAPWRKNLLHVAGGRTFSEVNTFKSFIDSYKAVAEGQYLGGRVSSLSKASGDEVERINISQQLNTGVLLTTLFGHSGRTVNDVEIGYASDDRLGYRNKGKYPFVLVNGCQSGDVFNWQYTYAEDWTMRRPDNGAIGWIAHSAVGYAYELHAYSSYFYSVAFGDSTYIGKAIGKVQQETSRRYAEAMRGYDLGLTHAEQIILQGDPGVALVPFSKPDYAVSRTGIFARPFGAERLTAAADSFQVGVVVANYGKVRNQPFVLTVRRTLGDGTSLPADTLRCLPIAYRDTLYVTIRNRGGVYGGNQTFEVFVDATAQIDEYNENNNIESLQIDIPAVGAVPLFPREYSIVSAQPVRFVAQSTLKPLETRSYRIELDTAATFTSPARMETTVSGGLLVNWETTLPAGIADSTVVYWRISLADRPIGPDNSWTESSFVYIPRSPEGWSQSRFPQFSKASLASVARNTATGLFEFTGNTTRIDVQNYGPLNQTEAYKQAQLLLNGGPVVAGGRCNPDANTLVAVALRRTNVQPYLVVPSLNCGREPFAAHYLTNAYINGGGLADFINRVGSGDYVLLFTTGTTNFTTWTPALRQLLAGLGADAAKVAALKNGDPYILLGQKGAAPAQAVEIYPDYAAATPPNRQALTLQHTLQGRSENGAITSTLIGPASLWGTAYHAIRPLERPSADQWQLDVLGVTLQGTEAVVASDVRTSPFSLDFLKAGQYPYLKLRLQARDTASLTPPQLRKWQVIYDGVPEGLINTGLVAADAYRIPDQAEGAAFKVPVVFQNISPRPFTDSLTVEYTLLNTESRTATKASFKIRPPAANGDTVRFNIPVNTARRGGPNELQVFVNPRLIPEQSYGNNVLTVPFNVQVDRLNPLLEVTFDGQRIMDGEIVSPTPLVVVRLKDENRVLVRKDTAGMLLFLKRPGGTGFERISEGAFRWVPAGPDNDFRLEWQPAKLPDGVYTLEVVAADKANNPAGSQPYRISFEVVNASTITHFYPYPNPFSSGTRFVFTLTGATVPDQIKIQIMTVSGKVVREITQDELGPVRIGHNISSYFWDGTDEFGDKLANGVYLYRVMTRLGGQELERRATAADRAFTKDFGKMYILR